MSSNAYLATDGEKLMKVGKANNPKRREKQIDLTITLTVACLDEVSAYRIEDQLRHFIAERGGIKHASTVDWFAFDPQIYRMVCEFAANLDGYKALSEEESQDAEIDVLRRRYFKLLVDESRVDSKENILKAENENLQRKIVDLEKELDEERKEKSSLLGQMSEWKGMFKGIRESLRDRGDKPIRPESLLNVLNSLVPEIFE
jgi:hypothetical protein